MKTEEKYKAIIATQERLIEKYEIRHRHLLEELAYLKGKCYGFEKFWKIWNGENED